MGAIVWVEGLIGAGKTTLTTTLAKRLGFREILEPIGESPYLQLFYEDQKRWASMFQIDMLARRAKLHRLAAAEAECGRGAILDRGIPGDMVFAGMHRDAGNIHPLEWLTYLEVYAGLMTNVRLLPRVLVYLDVKPEVALERVQARGRSAEGGLDLTYLRRLRDGYERMLEAVEHGEHDWSYGLRVCRVPWNSAAFPLEDYLGAIKAACGITSPT